MNFKTFYSLLISLLFCLKTTSYAQEGVVLTTGYSIPELLHIGLNYQFDQDQIGINYGVLPGSNTFSISAQYFYHYGGISKVSTKRKPWFFKFGFTHLQDETKLSLTKYKYVNAQLGRECSFTKQFGIRLELGLIYEVDKEKIEKEKSSGMGFGVNFDFKLLPAPGIIVYYKL